jgi:hypothetical protein
MQKRRETMTKSILALALITTICAGSGCSVGGPVGPVSAGVFGDGPPAAERLIITRSVEREEEEGTGPSWPEITILGVVITSGVVVGLLAGVL